MPGDYFLAELIEAQDDVNKCIVADVSPPWYLSKEKKTQRTEMKKKKKKRRKGKKLIVAGGIRTNNSVAWQLSKIRAPLTSRPMHPTDNIWGENDSLHTLSVGCVGREARGAWILLNCQATELLVRIPPATINFFPFLLSFSFFSFQFSESSFLYFPSF